MFYSDKDKEIMGALYTHIETHPHEQYTIKFGNGTIIKAVADSAYETDNGLEMEDEGYEEYNACAVQIEQVIANPTNDPWIKRGGLTEINYHNYPKITDSKGNIVK